jgi:DNA-binding MarR family transcriptional regulator
MHMPHTDAELGRGEEERHENDVSIGIVERLVRASRHVHRELESSLRYFGLDPSGFDVLAALKRQEPAHVMSPTALRRTVAITSGAMTSKIDRLERLGLVSRAPDPHDRRGVQVVLTQAGMDLVDRAISSRLQLASDLVSQLSQEEQVTVASLLDKLSGASPSSNQPPPYKLRHRSEDRDVRQDSSE